MQRYLFVSNDDTYTRNYVNPDEFKAAAKNNLQIFELQTENGIISKYCPDNDNFDNEIPRKF